MAVVGIDLGTTNTVVGIARDGHVTAIRDGDAEYLIPSVVSFHPGGNVLVGRTAKERRVVDARNTIYSIKRLIGRSWNSEEVSHARARFPFEMREGPGQAALVVARGETFTLPEISAFVLRHAKSLAEKSLGEPVDRAVITVPANFNDLQRAATKVAGRVAGLEVLRILNEPTAAALAYGYGKGKGERVAIYDFGGGTFDVTILDLSGNVFEVLATAGNTFLGGDDIDIAIAERMAKACMERYRIDARADAQVFERLRYHAERLKVTLTATPEATVDVPDVGQDSSGRAIRLTFRMTRTELEGLATPMVDRTFEVCDEALRIARISPTDVNQVVLVGGSTRFPLVRERVENYFGQPPLTRINPDEVVAIGAAIQANALTGQERRRSVIPRPPVPAARGADGAAAKSRPPGRAGKTDPFGMTPGGKQPPSSRPPRAPSAAPAPDGERRRVITGMGLGPAMSRSSRPPPLPARKPPAKGGTLGGLGTPAALRSSPPELPTQPSGERPSAPSIDTDLDDSFDPPTPVTPFFPDDEPTKVGTAHELLGVGQSTLAGPLPRTEQSTGARVASLFEVDSPGEDQEPTTTVATSPALASPPASKGERPGPRFNRTMLGAGMPHAAHAPEPAPAAPVPVAEPPAPVAPASAPPSLPLTPPPSFAAARPEAHQLTFSEPPRASRPPLPLLVDVTPLSLCVETVGGFRDVIIARNTPVPCEQSHKFVTSAHDQNLALVRVGQGESERFEENTLLGEVELSGLRRAPRGEVNIVVTFSLDTDGMLDVRAVDAETGHVSTARLRLVGLPDADEVGRMTARHQLHRAE